MAIGDLSRLQKEKQTVEQQIADLFAFLSKQKNDKPGSGFVTVGHNYALVDDLPLNESCHLASIPPMPPTTLKGPPAEFEYDPKQYAQARVFSARKTLR